MEKIGVNMSQPHFKTGITSKKKGFIKDKVALVVRKESQPFVNVFWLRRKRKVIGIIH